MGLVLVALAAVWLSTRPSLTTKARMWYSHNAAAPEKTSIEQPRFTINLPGSLSSETNTGIDTEQINIPQDSEHQSRATSHETRDTRFHTVRQGETLSDISYRYYGSANKWQKILDANRQTIKDANRLKPGTKLIIPN